MLPLAWFYIALVVFLYSLLLFVELRNRAKRHVKGFPSLPYISPEGLDSLLVIEQDVIVVELSSRCCVQRDTKNSRCPQNAGLPNFRASFKTPLVARFSFSMIPPRAVQWSRVECIVNDYAIPNVSVSKEVSNCVEHQADGLVVASSHCRSEGYQ